MSNAPGQQRRARARRRVLQALYQWQLTEGDSRAIEQQFLNEYRLGRIDLDYFSTLLRGITDDVVALDAVFDPFLDRPAKTLDPIELALLRLGTFELMERIDVPYRVVIDQAVELAHGFGAEQSHRFINGVLDKVGKSLPLRQAELRHAGLL